VFTTTKGAVRHYSNVRKEFKKLLREGDVPEVWLQELRETCATILTAQRVAQSGLPRTYPRNNHPMTNSSAMPTPIFRSNMAVTRSIHSVVR